MMASIPKQAAVTLNDMLDTCGEVKPGEHVLILANVDGLYGGPNLVDEQAVGWIQAAVQMREARASVLWIDEIMKQHEWGVPRMVKAALAGADLFINNSFELTTEEIRELREVLGQHGTRMVRNFATTAPLLASTWAQTPYELVAEIRMRAAAPFQGGLPWRITDPNGTELEGTIGAPQGNQYAQPRGPESKPFPEWVYPPINIEHTTGVLVFDRTLSWWSRYIGISPFFAEPVRLTVDDGRVRKIEGGMEAEALQRFLDSLVPRLGDAVYDFVAVHSGIHPNAVLEPHQCFDLARRRWVEHAHTCNIHFHIGNVRRRPNWPYMLHITADIRESTWDVGDTRYLDKGHLFVLDDPVVRAIAARYPNRPGLDG